MMNDKKAENIMNTATDDIDHIDVKVHRSTGFDLDVSVEVAKGGVTVLFGPSGCGKTTVLRCAAGLERAAGTVKVAGNLWQDDRKKIFVPTYQRRIGYVFQEASLFDHLSVRQNLEYGLKRIKDASGAQRLSDAVELLGIGDLLDRSTGQLSGGERQRCAIARSLAIRPSALFMDEPLAALDHARRLEIMPWLEAIKRELKVPILYVTHSDEEVMRLADRLVIMQSGKIVNQGNVFDVWGQMNSSVADSAVSRTALLSGVVEAKDAEWGLMAVRTGKALFWVHDHSQKVGESVRMMVQDTDVSVSVEKPSETSIQNVESCTILKITEGADASSKRVELDCGGAHLIASVTSRSVARLGLTEGMSAWAQVKSVSVR